MSSLLFIPALFLGFPMLIGVWLAGLDLYRFGCKYVASQTAFVVALCVVAAALSLMTAPIWLLGWQSYAVVCAVYVFFVGIGAPHVWRTLRFLSLELDGNPNDQVPLPGDEPKIKK
jgi:hypothetical protein